jgi:hypothetical protein
VEILFVLMPVFIGVFVLAFVAILVFIIVQIRRQSAVWAENNRKPILSERSRIVAKRSATSGSVSEGSGGTVTTYYFATFENDMGERKEFWLDGGAYGLLVEGDEGTLTYQGTRYHRFERNLRNA